MRISERVRCKDFPCSDVNHDCHITPDIDLIPEDISIVMISEATPVDLKDYFYSSGDPLFQKTTVQAFKDAGFDVISVNNVLNLDVYLTTAVNRR
jgi:hypothetical protein